MIKINQATLIERIKQKVKNAPQVVTDDGLADAIKTAEAVFSEDFPLQAVADVLGTGDFDYPLPNAADKVWGKSSTIKSVEYPVGRRSPAFLDSAEYLVLDVDVIFFASLAGAFTTGETITGGTSGATASVTAVNSTNVEYLSLTGAFTTGETITGGTSGATASVTRVANQKLRFTVSSPTTAQAFRLIYTVERSLTDASLGQLGKTEAEALILLAASFYCSAISRFYSQSTDDGLEVDTVDYGGKADFWSQRADGLRKDYKSLVKIPENATSPAAMEFIDYDDRLQFNHGYITHRRLR